MLASHTSVGLCRCSGIICRYFRTICRCSWAVWRCSRVICRYSWPTEVVLGLSGAPCASADMSALLGAGPLHLWLLRSFPQSLLMAGGPQLHAQVEMLLFRKWRLGQLGLGRVLLWASGVSAQVPLPAAQWPGGAGRRESGSSLLLLRG